jgi:hypothetical protein
MKKKVFVLVPYDVPVSDVYDFAERLLEPHRFDPDSPRGNGRFDYLVGALEKSLNDRIAEGRLPSKVRRCLSGRICEMARLPPDVVPAALVTPNGAWHDLSDFGWRMIDGRCASNDEAYRHWSEHYREQVTAHPYCWVLEFWSHS